jgi:hypothetical protein
MSEKMIASLPFALGKFTGAGYWHDQSGKQGRYTTTMEFRPLNDEAIEQLTRRLFFNPDDSLQYEENSVVRFTVTRTPFLEAAIKHDDIEFRGQGYCLENTLHYDIELAVDNYLENTYLISEGRIDYLGSSTNKGNLTVWKEVLRRIE